ncbi:glycosyltransferase family 39 protein [Arthrobacter sp. AK04]|uniref:ArnT family glycosyltransferase n=1 Tax=Arthrobacter sp. AK04 TaxID=2900048 RepID=UPI001E4CB520|nr:glycosyltransferase family 39 protein [Arthrobacter sp. AK04]MCD5341615.1 glycosyltransferase family 39 protein [Arthrobacter sp. AK04]
MERNGWANPYYSAAAQAGSQDWKAFFFGSLDAGNLVTIDKPPLSIWIMSLSIRLFGLNSWAILVPQALIGVATTWMVYKLIRRSHSAAPALWGGLIYATTPVVFLMSRFNNPEPLLGLLTVAAAFFVVRAIEDNRWSWYLLAGASLGLGFMAKQIQAFIIVPALVLTVLLFGAGALGSRLLRLLASLAALATTGGWWMTIVDLTPTGSRPYIGGSTTNSMLELTLDYNGLARFLRFSTDSQSVQSSVVSRSETNYDGGLHRLFNANFAPEGAWLLLTSIACCLTLGLLWRQSERTRGQAVLTTMAISWLLTVCTLLSLMGTMTHTYYVFSLVVPLAIVVPLGLNLLWNKRHGWTARMIGAFVLVGNGYVGLRIFQYSDDWGLWPIGFSCVTLMAIAGWLSASSRLALLVTAAFVAIATVLAPIATNIITLQTPQSGTNPLSGPVSNNPNALSAHLDAARRGDPPLTRHLGFGVQPSALVTALLQATPDADWAAATYTAQNAAQYQLATQRPVIAIGGWLGTDPAPTFGKFKELVSEGRIAYFIWQQPIVDEVPLGPDALSITEWIRTNYRGENIDGVRVYDLRR